jgi:hypothetical protein
MSNTLNQLMERNLLEVFGQRDSARRKIAINAIYTENCTFFETNEEIIGRDALNAKVESLLKGVPGFVFHAAGLVDPAMGSGHFLVRATEWLGEKIMGHPTTRPMTEQIIAQGPRAVSREEISAIAEESAASRADPKLAQEILSR